MAIASICITITPIPLECTPMERLRLWDRKKAPSPITTLIRPRTTAFDMRTIPEEREWEPAMRIRFN